MSEQLTSLILFYFLTFAIIHSVRMIYPEFVWTSHSKSYFKKMIDKSTFIEKIFFTKFKLNIPKFYLLFNKTYIFLNLIFFPVWILSIFVSDFQSPLLQVAKIKFGFDVLVEAYFTITTNSFRRSYFKEKKKK